MHGTGGGGGGGAFRLEGTQERKINGYVTGGRRRGGVVGARG